MKQNHPSPVYILLGFLYANPSHGYELHQKLCEVFGHIWHVSQSQTYMVLKRLENQGYIRATLIEQEKLPPRKVLSITQSGIDYFSAWLWMPAKPSVQAIRIEFTSRLYFIQQYHTDKTIETIDMQIEKVNTGLEQLKLEMAGLSEEEVFNRLALDLRVRLLESIVDWLAGCRQEFARNLASGDKHA